MAENGLKEGEQFIDLPAEIVGMELKKEGLTKEGRPWKLMKYTLRTGDGKRFASSFHKFDIGTKAKFKAIESPNEKNPKYPFLQITSLVENISELPAKKQAEDKGTVPTVDMGQFDKAYQAKVPKDKSTFNHYVGTLWMLQHKGSDKIEKLKQRYGRLYG